MACLHTGYDPQVALFAMELNCDPDSWGQNSPARLAVELARRYGCPPPLPFARFMERLRQAAACEHIFVPPDYLEPWHWPLFHLLADKSRDLRILDLECGIPLLLHFLARCGFTALHGAEDSRARPGALEAAREFCALSSTPAAIEDVAGSSAEEIVRAFGGKRFDVVTRFSAVSPPDFALIANLLRGGGLLVAETALETMNEAKAFETLAVFPDLGFRLPCEGGVAIFRKRPPPRWAAHVFERAAA
jgi:hypothetical protein